MMTLALAVIIPLSLLIYSNSRITEAKETLRAEIGALRTEMEKKHSEILASLERIAGQVRAFESAIETRIKIHELEHHR